MKTIRLKVDTHSTFASFPKGDMIFGHFAYYLFLNGDQRLSNYLTSNPPIIFSDFLPLGFLPRPALPMSFFGSDEQNKKELRQKEWIDARNLQNGDLTKLEKIEFVKSSLRVRNSINRRTFTTDDEIFAPYSIEEFEFCYEPSIYVVFDERFQLDEIVQLLNRIGKSGFGKKSSSGKGFFGVSVDENFTGFAKLDTKCYLTIAPTLPQNSGVKEIYCNTFNRFGKYSNSSTPFKKPVLMADSAAVVRLDEPREFIGCPANNGTADKPSLLQGYSMVVPFRCDIGGGQ